jgi:hypothetical protein
MLICPAETPPLPRSPAPDDVQASPQLKGRGAPGWGRCARAGMSVSAGGEGAAPQVRTCMRVTHLRNL